MMSLNKYLVNTVIFAYNRPEYWVVNYLITHYIKSFDSEYFQFNYEKNRELQSNEWPLATYSTLGLLICLSIKEVLYLLMVHWSCFLDSLHPMMRCCTGLRLWRLFISLFISLNFYVCGLKYENYSDSRSLVNFLLLWLNEIVYSKPFIVTLRVWTGAGHPNVYFASFVMSFVGFHD